MIRIIPSDKSLIWMLYKMGFALERNRWTTDSKMQSWKYKTLFILCPNTEKLNYFPHCYWDLENADFIPYKEIRFSPLKKISGYHMYDIKLHLMVKLQFWRSKKCGIFLHCHYSQVHFDLEWLYLLGFHS